MSNLVEIHLQRTVGFDSGDTLVAFDVFIHH